jgi:hypothetical protein
MNLHEWGDEKDCFTKEDLTTLYVLLSVQDLWLTYGQETYYENDGKPSEERCWRKEGRRGGFA